jgi:guanylate kinase
MANEPGPLLIILSGPSGVGKDVILSEMKLRRYPAHYVVTATTRPQRAGERDGVDYWFVSQEAFNDVMAQDGYLEWAEVYGHWYGVPKEQVKQALDRGEDVIAKVDIQGMATIKRLVPEAVAVFLAPPSLEELENRLRQRKTESGIDLERRLKKAKEEMKALPYFEYVVVNHTDGIDEAVSQISAIIMAEKCRTAPRRIDLS